MPLCCLLRWNSFLEAGCFSPKRITRLPQVQVVFRVITGWHLPNIFLLSHHRGFWCSWLFLMENFVMIDMSRRTSEPSKNTVLFPAFQANHYHCSIKMSAQWLGWLPLTFSLSYSPDKRIPLGELLFPPLAGRWGRVMDWGKGISLTQRLGLHG